jgi:transcriptional regulator with GAF, ATPase, and Fis domain
VAVAEELAVALGEAPWRLLVRVAEGASSVVWRASHADTGRLVALKVAKAGCAEILAREALLLARVGRRWGPSIIDAWPGFLATDWVDGRPLDPEAAAFDRQRLAAQIAHAVGRALEELHEAGVRHGDVKPANVLVGDRLAERDSAAERGATLIDLSLGVAMVEAAGDATGATPRYAAPELAERGEAGPPADLWALGMMLAEILEPRLAREADPRRALLDRSSAVEDGPARWVDALLATAPGGRPSAAWLARQAARWLGLRSDEQDAVKAREDRVRREYLRERSRDIAPDAVVSPKVTEPARGWLEDAIAFAKKLAAPSSLATTVVEPLSPLRRARWAVGLVGPSAASWVLSGAAERAEGELVARALQLARLRAPASWTCEDLFGPDEPKEAGWSEGEPGERAVRLARELAQARPHPWAVTAAEEHVSQGVAPSTLVIQLAGALTRAGETGRAWAVLSREHTPEALAMRAEVARRRGDTRRAGESAQKAIASGDEQARWSGQATSARLAWDAGDLAAASAALDGARGGSAAEVRALIAWRRGDYDKGLAALERALADAHPPETEARLQGVRGLLELARGATDPALYALGRAVELSTQSGAVVDEATYLTSDAAAAAEAGHLARALSNATRAALLWERLGRPERAARAWLARAGGLALIGAQHETDEAAGEACARAREAGDRRAEAYARWAQVEARLPGDAMAREWALEAASRLRGGEADDELRATARLLVWAPDAVGDRAVAQADAKVARASAPARWEWWGARAHAAAVAQRSLDAAAAIVEAMLALIEVPAPLGSRGPALAAAVRLAREVGDGEASRRFEAARIAAARALRQGTPVELRSCLAAVSWARIAADGEDVTFAPGQVAQLEAIVRALSTRDRLRPLLEQVLDTLVMWTGVERGLLLLRAPDGRLVPRAARNLARRDLCGEQLTLSRTIAGRALDLRDAVVATDALSTLGDMHASVHALKLRSVLAVPLLARGEALGVVYLDDRVRRGAFGPRELAWVRVIASQAAMAIADARDAVLLRRAARRAERARARLEALLGERETELEATRTRLELAGSRSDTRYRYDAIAGRGERMRELLRWVDRVTPTEVPVLIVGESGTGKELVARAIHSNGPRGRQPFVSENCASVPEALLESTLFGHVRGAFTGASATRAGLFDVADGGSLFLDEIGEMSLAMQSKLLRVLQDGEVRPVGSDRARRVDVRVIAATHRDLAAMVASGAFRDDLLYRLNVITLEVPALRERAEDIPYLVEHFVDKHASGRTVRVTRAAMTKLSTFAWPGNVRQLENEIRRALVLGEDRIDVAELSAGVQRGGGPPSGLNLRSRVDALENELVHEALAKTRGNQTRAAQMLGLSRFGLQKMMKRLGVKAPE